MKKDWCSKSQLPGTLVFLSQGPESGVKLKNATTFRRMGLLCYCQQGTGGIFFSSAPSTLQLIRILPRCWKQISHQFQFLVLFLVFLFSCVFAGIWGGHFEKLCQRLLTPGHFMAVVFWAPICVPLLLTIGKTTTHGPLSNTLLSFLCHYQF